MVFSFSPRLRGEPGNSNGRVTHSPKDIQPGARSSRYDGSLRPVRRMTRLDSYLVYAESHRATVCAVGGVMVVLIAWADWILPNTSVGFLYLIPVLLAAPALNGYQILTMAVLCGYLREALDPLQSAGLPMVPNPANWAAGSFGRFTVAACGFAMTGFFVRELNQRRQLLMEHLAERERQMLRQQETELQVRMLI